MAKTPQLDAIARVAPILRGLLAEPTGDDDHPYRPVILKRLASWENSRKLIELGAPRSDETDRQLRARFAASLQKSRSEFISLPGVGAFQILRPKSKPGYDPRLAGRTALVTGAAGAIGYGICRGLLERGCNVTITDLPGGRFEKFVAEFR